MKRYLFIIIIILGISITWLWNVYHKEKQERLRAERNITALNTEISYYTTKTGKMVTRIAGLELSNKELQKLIPELHNEITELKVKLKNALSVTKITTEFKYLNRDSIIYVPIGDSLRVFEISEEYIKAQVNIKDCSLIPPGGFKILNIPNELIAVPEIKYKGWWFWKRPVSVNLDVKCSNPYIKVTKGIFVKLK